MRTVAASEISRAQFPHLALIACERLVQFSRIIGATIGSVVTDVPWYNRSEPSGLLGGAFGTSSYLHGISSCLGLYQSDLQADLEAFDT